ncbi:MAG: sigma-54 dependent transcriptional regulator [Candidatus Brocadiaceae bacterium]|nr:sigma-54 dependent transcriptional regulator [Candidatus Brocadiaceae bacterium]
MNSTKILIVEDEAIYRDVLNDVFVERNLDVETAASGEEGLEKLKNHEFQIIVTDLKLPGEIGGLELLQKARERYDVSVLVITAYGEIETAVEAMRQGAFNYIIKPFDIEEICRNITRMVEQRRIKEENRYLQSELEKAYGLKRIVGNSRAMKKVLTVTAKVAFSNATILITGETGTGKELIARAIHFMGKQKEGKFVAINCATLSDTFLESALFGHVKGAFTGAIKDKKGFFEEADGGTLFMDEIGDISLSLQAKILRVLQEGEFFQLGNTTPKKVEVRIIAATNQQLSEKVAENTFREDLFYRLNVISIKLPPLRERKEDIPLLSEHFISTYNRKEGKDIKGVSPEVKEKLCHYHWPGNVRELENVIERAVILCNDSVIFLKHLPENIVPGNGRAAVVEIPVGITLEEAEKKIIQETLRLTHGNKKQAADLLGISLRKIAYRVKEWDVPFS